MKIDRALFLAATGALAGAGCYINTTPAPNAPAPAPVPVAAAPAPGAPPRQIGSHGIGALSRTAAPPAACLNNDAVIVGDCNAMHPPAVSCPGYTFPQAKCNAYKAYLKPRVAAQAVACMTALDSSSVCNATNAYQCGFDALKSACPDASLAQLCSTASGVCHETAENCVNWLSGLNDAGRQKVAACVAQGCTAGLYSCLEGL